VNSKEGLDYMLNQKIDLTVLSLLAEYVNGSRPLNYDEIQGTVRIAKRLRDGEDISISLLSNNVESVSSTEVFSQNVFDNPLSNADLDSEVDVSEYISQNTSCTQIILEPVKTRRARSVWSDKFIAEFKSKILAFIENKGVVKQETLFNYFESNFKYGLKPEDLEKSGPNGRPRWQLKLHDNINVWFIKTGFVQFGDSSYAFIKQKTAKEAEQKTLQI